MSAAALAEVAAELGLGDALLLGKGEDAVGRPGEAVDPGRRHRGRDRRRLPRRRAGTPPRRWCSALLGDRIADAAAGPGGQDYKTRLQELAARALEQLPATRCATRVPTTPSGSSPPSRVGGAVVRRGRGPIEEAGRAGRGPRGVGGAAARGGRASEAG